MKNAILFAALLVAGTAFGQINYNGCDIYTGTDPNTNDPVDQLHLPRSMWVNDFADLDANDNFKPFQHTILCVGQWLSQDNLFQKEKDLLEYVTDETQNDGAKVNRLILYSITYLLNDGSGALGGYNIRDEQPDISSSGAPSGVLSMTMEQHLARFIEIAKGEYDLQIQAVLPSNGSHDQGKYLGNNFNVYDFTLTNSLFIMEYNEFLGNYTGGDPCLQVTGPVPVSAKTNTTQDGDEEWLWSYFDIDEHETVFPVR